MRILVEQIIVDFHERQLPKLTRRECRLPLIRGKIDTVIGMRRTGKTSLLFQLMQDYMEQGIVKEELLYINFDDERLFPMTAGELHEITDAYFRLYPAQKDATSYLFFD